MTAYCSLIFAGIENKTMLFNLWKPHTIALTKWLIEGKIVNPAR